MMKSKLEREIRLSEKSEKPGLTIFIVNEKSVI